MIINADRRNKFDAINVSAASFRHVFSSLFARLTRSPPAHICPRLSNDLSLFPNSRSGQLSHFYARFCLRNPPSQARTHSFLPFVPVSSSDVLVCAAWLRCRSHSCSSGDALLDSCRSAALPERGSSDREQRPRQLGERWDKSAECAGALLPTIQHKLNTTHLTANQNVFNKTSDLCVRVFTCKYTSRFSGDSRSADVGSMGINGWKSTLENHPSKTLWY